MKHRYIIVLAANTAEAHQYARRAMIPRFTYRAPASASSIRGLQSADVHVLPTFAGRRDRHALLAELRHGRDIVMLDVHMPAPAEKPPVDQGDGMGEQLTIDDFLGRQRGFATDYSGFTEEPYPEEGPNPLVKAREEYLAPMSPQGRAAAEEALDAGIVRLDKIEETASGSETGTSEPSEDAAPDAPRRRRTRCPQCGDLVLGLASHTLEKHAAAASPALSEADFL